MGAFLDAALLFTGVEVTFISGVVGGIKHSGGRPSPSQSVEVTDRQNGKEGSKCTNPNKLHQSCIMSNNNAETDPHKAEIKTLIVTDCETERAALLERSSRAGAEVLARRCQVDNLSTRLSSLARLHKTLVGNQGHTLAILETLRSQLGALSNYTPPIK